MMKEITGKQQGKSKALTTPCQQSLRKSGNKQHKLKSFQVSPNVAHKTPQIDFI